MITAPKPEGRLLADRNHIIKITREGAPVAYVKSVGRDGSFVPTPDRNKARRFGEECGNEHADRLGVRIKSASFKLVTA